MDIKRFTNARLPEGLCDIDVADGRISRMAPAGVRPADARLAEDITDLAGAYVYPGFRDAHCHLFSTAEAALGFDASEIKNASGLIEAGRAYLASGARGALYAKRLNDVTFANGAMPDRSVLDRIAPDRPVIVVRVCGHVAAVNSHVLNRFPELSVKYPDGVISENDLDALPTLRDLYGEDDFLDALKDTVRTMLSFGITAVSSNDFGRFGRATDELLLHKALSDAPGFSYRSQFSPLLPFNPTDLLPLAMKSGVRPAVKVFRDGSLGGRTAWLGAPYSDAPDQIGQDTLDDETHEAVFGAANRLGLQVLTHAIGDEAIRRTLDAFEKSSDPANPLRHAIVHAQITDDALVERMKRLNLVAIVQPLFTASDAPMAASRLGARYASAYAFKAMADAGIRVAFSSDAPVERYNPLLTLAAAMRGKTDAAGSAFTFDEALRLHTEGAAAVDFAESESGRLEPGFTADFTVFANDLSQMTPERLETERCLMTVAGGQIYRTD